VSKPSQRSLTPGDWANAALRAIARGGVDAVAVETVAAELGATKGSFYWHFKNRDALVEAALEKWEQRWTEAVIEKLEREPDPLRRLKTILAAGFELGPSARAEIALLAHPEHPAALRAVRRVAQRRIGYIAEQLEKLGLDAEDALDRAVLLYYVYIGHMQMTHVGPKLISDAARRRLLVQLVFDALVAGDLPARSGVRTRPASPVRERRSSRPSNPRQASRPRASAK
jgi:AcrR family transcriptional regulator